MIGTIIGHYKIESKLGEGGMGVVYKATDTKLNRTVAIKFLPERVQQDSDAKARFLQEAQAAAALNHANICTIYGVDEQDGQLYMAMEYIEGGTLRETLGSVIGKVTDAVKVAVQIGDALQEAHAKGIVHRDIKADNIMLNAKGQAKVMDFGLAKLKGALKLTRTSSTVGTLGYIAPEQIQGGEADPRSDIFSFGVLLFEMLTGKLPFRGEHEAAMMYSIVNEAPESIQTYLPDASPELAHILSRALEKDPDARYQNMADLIAALKSCKEPTRSRKTTPPERTIPSIVVLPFANLSPDEENEYFSDGLTEEIITDLSMVRALSVISRTSAMQLKGTKKDVRAIGRDLGVRYVLEGSVRKAGTSLRITAQLIDARTDAHLWAEKYNGTMEDVFDLQERVSREIVGALNIKLTADEDKRLADHPIANVRAFELYLQARQALRRHGPEAIELANKLLAQAVEIEGETPPLLALRAWAIATEVRFGLNRDLQPLEEAEAQAQALLALAPEAPYGHALLGYIEHERGHQAQAVKNFLSALERDPNDADTLFYLGISYIFAGQFERASETSKKFTACDPLAPFAWILSGVIPWFSGRYEEAPKYIRRGLEIDPQNLIIHWCIGYSYAGLGQLSEASKHVALMCKSAPDLPYTRQLQALVDALNGHKKRALESLALVDVAPLDSHHKFHLSESFAMAGDIDRALDIVEHAVAEGFYPYSYLAEHCPFMAPLRGLPRFDAILAKAKSRMDSFERDFPKNT